MTRARQKSKTPLIIAPSILSADPLNFESEIKDIEACGADWHHCDVMDGHFVPNLTFGIPLITALKKKAKIPLDVHIMVSNPEMVAVDYCKAGADYLTFHCEAATHSHRLLQLIRSHGVKAGLALNPGTPIEWIQPMLEFTDMITIMSVNPGFGGQAFIPQMIEKVAALSRFLKEKSLEKSIFIAVDGGVNEHTAAKMVRAGANVLVAGSFVYGSNNRKKAISLLKSSVK